MHAKIYDRKEKHVVFDLWVKPQTNGFHEFVFIILYFVAVGSFTPDGHRRDESSCIEDPSFS